MNQQDLTPGTTYYCDNVGEVELVEILKESCLVKERRSGEVFEVVAGKINLIEK